jgi:hypothetical protein
MDIAEFLRQLTEQQNTQPNATSIGNENLNLNAYTRPTLGGNVNAYQETPVGLLSGTIGKEGTNPIYKDVALTNQNLRGGILSQRDDVAPYGEYRDGNVMARVMGGNYPNASAQYTTPLAGGQFTGGANYSKDGLGVNAEYAKQLNDWLFKATANATPYEKQLLFGLGKGF